MSEIRLQWSAIAGAKTYEVQVSPNGDFQNNLVSLGSEAQSVTGTQYAPKSSLQPQAYFWRVRPKDDASSVHPGAWSSTGTFTLDVAPAPTQLTPGVDVTTADTPPTISQPSLSWRGSSRASYYELNIGTDQNFSPGTFDAAPHNMVATVAVPPKAEAGLARSIPRAFPSASLIQVRDVVSQVTTLLTQMSQAIAAAASIAILAGIAVLIGAIAASRERRVYDSVILKLLDEEDSFITLAAAGLVTQFGLQALINMMVNVKLAPSKGMTLPFVSYGGSSMVALAIGFGLLLAFTRRNPYLNRSPYVVRWSGR